MTNRNFVTYLVLFIVTFSGLLFVWFSFQEESLSQVRTGWGVDQIIVDDIDRTEDYYFKALNFTNLQDNKLLYPSLKSGINEPKKATWRYRRTGLCNATIEMINTSPGKMDGVYNIEFIVHTAPRRIRFYSKDVEFICTERLFTINNTSIKLDPFNLPEKEE